MTPDGLRYSRVELDPDTQMSRYLDPTGRPVMATSAAHDATTRTRTTSKPTTYNQDGRQMTDDTMTVQTEPD